MLPEIFVVNLARCADRRTSIERQLTSLGLPYRIFPATDGSRLTPAELNAISDPEVCGRLGLVPSQIACAHSHARIYQTIASEGIEQALIVEDDLQLFPELPDLLPPLCQALQAGEAILVYWIPGRGCRISTDGQVPLPNGYSLRYPLSVDNVLSCVAYLINHGTASRMARATSPIRGCADYWGTHQHYGGVDRVRVVMPRPLDLRLEFPSEIGIGRTNLPVLRPFIDYVGRRRMFPFNQFLTWNRRRNLRKLEALCSLTDEPSALATV